MYALITMQQPSRMKGKFPFKKFLKPTIDFGSETSNHTKIYGVQIGTNISGLTSITSTEKNTCTVDTFDAGYIFETRLDA